MENIFSLVLQGKELPEYSVKELNDAISSLLNRAFAPLFILNATISKSQLKKGHLWLSFTDNNATIDGVIWSSRLKDIQYKPNQDDGVVVIGKLNFWSNQARLSVQVIDIRPSFSTVLRKFELTKSKLKEEGLIDVQKRRNLPEYPKSIAILTSSPSSALADMLRTAKEQWPLTKLFIFSIPVQGIDIVAAKVQKIIKYLSNSYQNLGIEAIILARGGGSRDDLMLFDNENLCRELANFPIPVITGIGHEDDLTVADLVADHRAATPTAAIVDLLPNREMSKVQCSQLEIRLKDYLKWFIFREKNKLQTFKDLFTPDFLLKILERKRVSLFQIISIFQALSPDRWLKRGFAIITNKRGHYLNNLRNISKNDQLNIELFDGNINVKVNSITRKK